MSPFEKELLKVLKNIEKELHIMNRKEELPIKTGTTFLPNFMTHPLTSKDYEELSVIDVTGTAVEIIKRKD